MNAIIGDINANQQLINEKITFQARLGTPLRAALASRVARPDWRAKAPPPGPGEDATG